MNRTFKKYAALVFIAASGLHATAQDVTSPEVIKKNGYTLTFETNDAKLDPALKKKLIETFFVVYPKLSKAYNPKTAREVKFFVDTAYDGVAATANDQVTFSAGYMAKHPADIDVVTHEGMHIVQNYGETVGPGWLTEGIADFARNQFGVNNAAAHWAFPDFKPEQSYENAYRTTARFLFWIEKHVKAGTVKALDQSLRDHTYTPDIWVKLTHKDLDSLWVDYAKNPAI